MDITFHVMAILCPIAMAILAQRPGTRTARVTIYPVGVISAVLALLSLGRRKAQTWTMSDISNPNLALYGNLLLWTNFSLVGLYAFSNEVYRAQIHPIPRQVKWRKLRESRLFKTFDIFFSSVKKVDHSPVYRIQQHNESLLHTLKWGIIHIFLVDLFTLPLELFRHKGLYQPDGSRDFASWCISLSVEYRIPVVMVKMGWMMCYAATGFCGMQAGQEMAKVMGVASGIWAKEEWPDLMDRPYLATSMIEFWGKRYHQLLRSYFHTILAPFNLPKPIYLILAFTISALHHLLIMYPLTGHFPLHYIQFFIGCSIVCLFEHSIYKATGRRVEGMTGWVWTFMWFSILGSRSIKDEVENGGFEGFRPSIMLNGWSVYPLDHVYQLIRRYSRG